MRCAALDHAFDVLNLGQRGGHQLLMLFLGFGHDDVAPIRIPGAAGPVRQVLRMGRL